MRRLLYNSDVVAEFVYAHAGGGKPSLDAVGFGTYDEKEGILGGVAFDHAAGNAIFMHIASAHPRWITPSLIWAAFDYPFRQMNLGKIVCMIASDNAPAMRLARHFGLRPVYHIEDAVDEGIDLVVHEMKREECRFFNNPRYQLEPERVDPALIKDDRHG